MMRIPNIPIISKLLCDGLLSRKAGIITFFGLVLVLSITLFPFNFNFKEQGKSLDYYFPIMGWGESGILDILKNVFLLIPFGFGLTCLMSKRMLLAKTASLLIVIIAVFGLSYIVETLQIYLPSREPSLVDVFSNSAGGILGYFCFYIIKQNLLLSFLGYAVFVFIMMIPLQWAKSLKNWDNTFSLLLGNEQTGDRPWQGSIFSLYIADRALSTEEVAQAFSGENIFDIFGKSLLTYCQLNDNGSYHDEVRRLPDLVRKGEPHDLQQSKNIFMDTIHWFETSRPPVFLTQRIMESSQFTLGITASTRDTRQFGPARIVSISANTFSRNFTLGQKGSDLVFRLRTPLTGKNGTSPQMIVSDVFLTTNPHNLIITYDRSVLLIYVDEVLNSSRLELAPGAIPFNYLFHLKAFNLVGYKIMYYAVLFFPLGMLLSVSMKRMRGRLVIRIMLFEACVILTAYLFENVLTIIQHRNMRIENMILGVLFVSASMMFHSYMKQLAAKQ